MCNELMGSDAMIFVFSVLSFKPAFSLSSFTFIKRLFSSSSFSAIRVVSSVYPSLLILGAVTLRSHPEPEARGSRPGGATQEWWLHTGGPKGAILVEGKEERLCFAGAAVKRYPMPT